jgi:hypothetical protein
MGTRASEARSCQGFGRRPIGVVRQGAGAVVRKPSGKEPAGGGSRRYRAHYGDFDAVIEEAGTDEVVDGVVVRRRVAFDEARDARPWSRKMSATSRAGRSMGDRRQGGGPSVGSVRRTLPARMCSIEEAVLSNMTCTCPRASR